MSIGPKLKKIITRVIPILLLVLIAASFYGMRTAHAADGDPILTCNPVPWAEGVFSLNVCIQQGMAYGMFFLLTAVSYLVGIAGLVFDSAMQYGIVDMKAELLKITAIDQGWTIMRDVGNMIFIFILLYVAIATILNIGSIDTKRTIRNIIIVALLVNFSLFFTKVLIDASNVVSIGFYDLININQKGNIRDISAAFVQPLGIGSLFNPSQMQDFVTRFSKGDGSTYLSIAVFGVGGAIFLFAVALSFLFVSMLLILRFVILVFLLMLSPLPFFATILPSTRPYATKWWAALRGQLMFAPLYMMLLYVVMLINNKFTLVGATSSLMSDMIQDPKNLAAAQPAANGGGPVDLLVRFVIMLALLNLAAIIGTTAAQSSGGVIGGAVSKIRGTTMGAIKNARSAAVSGTAAAAGAAAGGTVSAARNTYGSFRMNQSGRAATMALEKDGDRLKALADAGDVKSKKQLEKLQSASTSSYGATKASAQGGYKAKLDQVKSDVKTKIETKKNVNVVDKSVKDDFKKKQDELEAKKAAYRMEMASEDKIINGKSKQDRIEDAEKEIKTAKSNFDSVGRKAASNIEDKRAQYALKIARPVSTLNPLNSDFYGQHNRLNNPTWLNANSASNQALAAQEFLEKARTATKTQDEKAKIKENKIRDTAPDAAKIANIDEARRTPEQKSQLDRFVKLMKSVNENEAKLISDDVLTLDEVQKHLTKPALKSLKGRISEEKMRKVVKKIGEDENNPAWKFVTEDARKDKDSSEFYFADLADEAKENKRLRDVERGATQATRTNLVNQARTNRQTLQQRNQTGQQPTQTRTEDTEHQESRTRERDTSDEL